VHCVLCALRGDQVETVKMCPVGCCVHCVVIRWRLHDALFLHYFVNIYVLDFAHDNTDVLCDYPEDGHVDRNT
jgi:hypothetical protein